MKSALEPPSFGPPETIRPVLADRPGVRTSGAAEHRGWLYHRAVGAVAPGIYRQPLRGGDVELAYPDPANGAWVEPASMGATAIALRRLSGGAPRAVAFYSDGELIAEVPGESAGAAAGSAAMGAGAAEVAAVADVRGGVLRAVDLARGTVEEAGTVWSKTDPVLAPLIAVSADGREALYMDSLDERGPTTLEIADLTTGQKRPLLGPVPGPSWLAGGFTPSGVEVLVTEMRLGDAPVCRILRIRKAGGAPAQLARHEVSQSAAAPVFVTPEHAVMMLSTRSWPLASYGPVDLYLVPLSGGAHVPITTTGDIKGRVRAADGSLWIEGGPELIRLSVLPRP